MKLPTSQEMMPYSDFLKIIIENYPNQELNIDLVSCNVI